MLHAVVLCYAATSDGAPAAEARCDEVVFMFRLIGVHWSPRDVVDQMYTVPLSENICVRATQQRKFSGGKVFRFFVGFIQVRWNRLDEWGHDESAPVCHRVTVSHVFAHCGAARASERS